MVYQTARAENETIEAVFGIQTLNGIKQTGNHVVTTRSLTTRKDDTNVHLLGVGLGSGLKLYDRHTVGVGEQLLDFFLVTYTLCSVTFLYFYCTLKSLRQLRLVSGTSNLQCTFFHNVYTFYNE